MARSRQKSIHITTKTRDDLLAAGLKQLKDTQEAAGIWLALPDFLLDAGLFPGALPLSSLQSSLPAAAFRGLEDETECSTGEALTLRLAQPGPLAAPPEITAPFWLLVPIPLDSWPNGCLLLTRDRPFDLSTLGKRFDQAVARVVLILEHALLRQVVSQYSSSLETLHTIASRAASSAALDETLQLLVQSTLEILPADTICIFVRSNDLEAQQPFYLGAAAWRSPTHQPDTPLPVPVKLIEAAISRAWPLTIEDVAHHKLKAELHSCGFHSGSLSIFPLKRQGRAFGVIMVHLPRGHVLASHERYMLTLVADQALAALEKAYTTRTLSSQLGDLSALQRMAQEITITLEQNEVLQIIVKTLLKLLDASAASIMLVDDDLVLRRTASAGDEALIPDPQTLNPGEGFAGRVALSAKPLSIRRASPKEASPLGTNELIQSLYVFPLKMKNRVIGVLSVASSQPGAFNEDAERIIAIASVQAAIALENSRLYHSERRKANELKTIIDLSHLITQHLHPEHIMDAAYQAIAHLMTVDVFVISILDRRTSEVVLTYVMEKGVRHPVFYRSTGNGLAEYVIETSDVVLIDDFENQAIPFEKILFDGQGPVRSVLAVPLLAGGSSIGMVAVQSYQAAAYSLHDLELLQSIANAIASATENSQLYAELEHRYQNLQESERKRLAFIQDISHELRNPLTFLKAYIDLLLTGDMGPLNKDQYQAISVVGEKTNTLSRLVSEITTLQTNPTHLLKFDTIDLAHILRNSVLVAQETSLEKKINLILDSPASIRPIQADPDRITQVVDNLLSNAIKFSFPEKQVVVRLQELPGYAQVSVNNQGETIAEADQARIFERFFRSNHRKDGLGLGLAIVRHIVEAHHGEVWFESDPETGTTFFFTLPYQQPEENLL